MVAAPPWGLEEALSGVGSFLSFFFLGGGLGGVLGTESLHDLQLLYKAYLHKQHPARVST